MALLLMSSCGTVTLCSILFKQLHMQAHFLFIDNLTSHPTLSPVSSSVMPSCVHPGERLGERLGERVIERAGERAVERAGERAMERAGAA